jgi:hypothetical protein
MSKFNLAAIIVVIKAASPGWLAARRAAVADDEPADRAWPGCWPVVVRRNLLYGEPPASRIDRTRGVRIRGNSRLAVSELPYA